MGSIEAYQAAARADLDRFRAAGHPQLLEQVPESAILAIADEQLAHFADISDDSRIRSLVSETPLADQAHRDAERTTAAMARHRADLVEQIARLEREQDELLDRLH